MRTSLVVLTALLLTVPGAAVPASAGPGDGDPPPDLSIPVLADPPCHVDVWYEPFDVTTDCV